MSVVFWCSLLSLNNTVTIARSAVMTVLRVATETRLVITGPLWLEEVATMLNMEQAIPHLPLAGALL